MWGVGVTLSASRRAVAAYFSALDTCRGVWGFGVWGLSFGVWGVGFGVWGSGFGVWGLGLGVRGSGFGARDWGCGGSQLITSWQETGSMRVPGGVDIDIDIE